MDLEARLDSGSDATRVSEDVSVTWKSAHFKGHFNEMQGAFPYEENARIRVAE